MRATQFLRTMHADQKRRFKVLLSAPPAEAQRLWTELQPVLNLHEQIEDTLLYTPMREQHGPGTPLGDWHDEHERQVDLVKAMIADVGSLDAADPRWRMTVGKINDLLHKHIMEEELEVFPRVDQALGDEQSQQIGDRMQSMLDRGPVLGGVQAAVEASPVGKILR
ncbi:MAG: hemerythrin domain-containing protein [Chloroflexi bacterium]|nr:hemerythrin domain-containing protein [Chloroflexota bacterium]MBV9545301.1 hemerythrin domain-containing protein [Chloroflexota bacterium]